MITIFIYIVYHDDSTNAVTFVLFDNFFIKFLIYAQQLEYFSILGM